MNSIGLQETQPRQFENSGFEISGRDNDGSDSNQVRGAETITTRVHVHNETSNENTETSKTSKTLKENTETSKTLKDVSKPFEHNAKTAASVADMIDQREFNQTIS